MSHKGSLLFVGMLVMLLAACSGAAVQDKSATVEVPDTTGNAAGGTMLEGAEMDKANLIGELADAGITVEEGDPVEQPFFAVRGQIIHLNSADVQVFEYVSAEDAQKEAALVAPDGGSVGTSMVTWMDTPHFYHSGKVIVLYVGSDQITLEVLSGLLGEQFAGR